MNRFIQELKRRNVLKASLSYAIIAWVLLQVADIIFPVFGLGTLAMRVLLILLLVGFPIWVIFAYFYESTPEGFKLTDQVKSEESIRKVTSKKLNFYIIGGLALVVVVLLVDKFFIADTVSPIVTQGEISLAVLPFENLSAPEDAYFARGITEDIFIQTSSISDYRILSSYTLKDYDTKGKTLQEIGEELGVSHVLLGNIRRSEDDIRVGCQLIATQDETALWANSYDKKMASIFELQKEIAVEIATSLMAAFDPASIEEEVNKPTDNLVAYDLYLKARDYEIELTGELHEKAAELYKEAINLDPYFANAYAQLSANYSLDYQTFGIYPKEYLDTAKVLAQKAIDLNPEYSGGWNALGIYYNQKGMREQSKAMYKKTLELNPNSAAAINNLANFYGQEGNMAEAIKMYKKAIGIKPDFDPTQHIQYNNLGWEYFYLGMHERSMACARRALELNENFYAAHLIMAVNHFALEKDSAVQVSLERYGVMGEEYFTGLLGLTRMYYEYNDMEKGLIYLEKLENHSNYNLENASENYIFRAHNYLINGRNEEAKKLLDEVLNFYLNQMEQGRMFQSYLYNISAIYTLKGDEEKALEWLVKLIDDGYQNNPAIIYSNLFESLHDNPDYQALMKRHQAQLASMRQQVIDDEASEQLDYLNL